MLDSDVTDLEVTDLQSTINLIAQKVTICVSSMLPYLSI